jgi:hypothetical protein
VILSSSNLSAITAKPSIIEDIDWILGTDSTQYPLAEKLRNINLAYYDAVTDIIRYNSNWEWDDTNKTDFPIGTTNMVASQRDYALPSNFLKLLRVEVKDSGGNFQKLEQFDESQVQQGLSEFYKGDGLPLMYREIGSSIELYPTPSATSTTLTAGLKIYYQRTQTELTNADASLSPGFPANFHRLLSLKASLDYAKFRLSSNASLINSLQNDVAVMQDNLRQYFASRNREVIPTLKVKPRNYD